MPGKRKKYYWDSCIFIAWITDEQREPAEMEGIEEIAMQVMNLAADLFTSELTKSEVLEGKMSPDQKDKFRKLFYRRNVVPVDVSGRVLELSAKIREWNSRIATPDAIHLATAILYSADEFHTTDGGGIRKRRGDLIPLNGNVAGFPLVIRTPRAAQTSLFSGVKPLQIGKLKPKSES